MSDDDEVQMIDEQDLDDGDAQIVGEAVEFDPATGMPVGRASSAAPAGDGSRMSDMPDIDSSAAVSRETWQLTLAAKNAGNTHDLRAPHMLGIDEAGRGPVLGSMVYGICWCPVAKLDDLRALKVADSKTLTFKQREQLFKGIQDCPWLGYEVDVISADRLSREMMRRQRINLNAISHDSAIMLIHAVIAHGVNVREVYVDTVGDAGKYQEKLSAIFPGVSITVSKKADSLFPIVSAASIAAKVTRDLNLEAWSFAEETPRPLGLHTPYRSLTEFTQLRCSRRLGSGYPGDPLTKIWLQNHLDPVFGYPRLVRFSWGTTKKILKGAAVQAEFGDEDDDDEGEGEEGEDGAGAGSQKMDKFFTKDAAAAAAAATPAKSASAPAAASSAAALVTLDPNNKRFSSLHESVTRKTHAIPHTQRIGWFQQHKMDLATTF